MEILILEGSARKKGNTAKISGWIEKELIKLGHGVNSIYLAGKDLKGCLGCAKCKDVPDRIGCVQKDDIPEILAQMTEADLVIFASPLYFWGVSAQLKAVIDRTYSLYTRYHQEGHASLIQGKKQALLLTGAGGFENNAEGVFDAFRRMQKPHITVNAGELFIEGCKNPEEIDDSVETRAIEFARKIVS